MLFFSWCWFPSLSSNYIVCKYTMPRVKDERIGKERQSCESCYRSKVKCAADGPGPCARCKDREITCVRGVQKPLGRTPGARNRRKNKTATTQTEDRYPLTPETIATVASEKNSTRPTAASTEIGDVFTFDDHNQLFDADFDFGEFLKPVADCPDAFLDCEVSTMTDVSHGSSATPGNSSSISTSPPSSSASSGLLRMTTRADLTEPLPSTEHSPRPFSVDLSVAFSTGSADDLFDHLPCTCKENIIQVVDTLQAAQQRVDGNNSNDGHPALDRLLNVNSISLGTITTFLDCLSIHDASLVLLVCHLLQRMLSLYQDAWFATTTIKGTTPPAAGLVPENGLTISFGAYKLVGEDAQAIARQVIFLEVAKIGGVLRRLEEGEAMYSDSSNNTLVPVLQRSLKQELRRLEDRLNI